MTQLRLLAGDDLSKYQTEPHPYMPEARMLALPNGDRLYLGDEGCTIHDKAADVPRNGLPPHNEGDHLDAGTEDEARGALRMDIWRRGKGAAAHGL